MKGKKEIRCPWCGERMHVKVAGSWEGFNGWTVCENQECQAEGPLIQNGKTKEEAGAAARIAALSLYKPLEEQANEDH